MHSFFDHESLLITSNVKEKASIVTYYRDYSFLKKVYERYLQIQVNILVGAQIFIENIDDINMAFDHFQEKFLKVTHSFSLYSESSEKTPKLLKWFINRVNNFSKRRKIHRQRKSKKLDLFLLQKIQDFRQKTERAQIGKKTVI